MLAGFYICNCNAQPYEEKIKHLNNILERSDYYKTDSVYTTLEEGLKEATKRQDTQTLGQLYLKIGSVFGIHGDHDKSVKYLYKALDMFVASGDSRRRAITFSNLAILANTDMKRKLNFLKKARAICIEECDTNYLGIILNALGVVYGNEGKEDSAMYYFQKAENLSRKTNYTHVLAMSMGNIASLYMKYPNYDKALKLSRKAIDLMPPEHFVNTVIIKSNILRIFFDRKMYDSTLLYFGLYKEDLAIRPSFQVKAYKLVSDTYLALSDPIKALEYHKTADSLEKNISQQNNKHLLQMLDMEHESELREKEFAELQAQSEKDKAIYISLIIVFMISVAFSIVLYYFQKEKARRNQEALKRVETEQKLVESQLKNSEFQRNALNNELKFTNKELSSFAASIVKNTDHLNDIKSHINMALNEKSPRKTKDQLHKLNMKVNQLFHKDEERKEFIKRTRQINHSLIFFLKSRYPDLSDNDVNLMVLLMLKFSSKEIATLSNMEVTSVKTKRYRLRKKLGLKTRENFDAFMDELIRDFKVMH